MLAEQTSRSTERVPGQVGINREILSWEKKKRNVNSEPQRGTGHAWPPFLIRALSVLTENFLSSVPVGKADPCLLSDSRCGSGCECDHENSPSLATVTRPWKGTAPKPSQWKYFFELLLMLSKKEACPLLWLAIQTEDRQAMLTTFTTTKRSPLGMDSQRGRRWRVSALWYSGDTWMPLCPKAIP